MFERVKDDRRDYYTHSMALIDKFKNDLAQENLGTCIKEAL